MAASGASFTTVVFGVIPRRTERAGLICSLAGLIFLGRWHAASSPQQPRHIVCCRRAAFLSGARPLSCIPHFFSFLARQAQHERPTGQGLEYQGPLFCDIRKRGRRAASRATASRKIRRMICARTPPGARPERAHKGHRRHSPPPNRQERGTGHGCVHQE